MRHSTFPAGRRLLLQWHVTERCNLRCTHCYQEGQRVREIDFESCLEVLGQYERLLDQLPTRAIPRGHITLTGGEPFVRRDFFDLLREIAQRRERYGFAILTNGTLIDDAVAAEVAELGPRYVQVSIEGSQETHDRIRGRGSFERATRGIRCLVRHDVRVMVSFTAHRGNYLEFPRVVRLGRKLGVSRVWSDRLIPCGNGAELDDLSLSPQEARSFFELMAHERGGRRQQRVGGTETAMHRGLQFLVGDGRPYRCTAGRSLLALLPNGDVLPCRRLPIPVGNAMTTELAEIYEGSAALRELRDESTVASGCEGCFYGKLCGGGLRCLAQAVTGSWKNGDPGCWLAGGGTV